MRIFKTCSVYYEYGLTEAGPRVSSQKIASNSIDSVGKAINGVEVKIIDSNGRVAKNNEYGLVHIKTPSIYLKYISGAPKFTSLYNDWLNTGDIGYFDANNELYIVGRADDVIIINAHKIYPSDVEKQIIDHTFIKECVVTKIEHNGNEFVGCLYVSEKEVDGDIREILKTKMMIYEIPRFFLRCDELPRTKTGKISIREVQAHLKKYISQE